jgi:hypothetical protein
MPCDPASRRTTPPALSCRRLAGRRAHRSTSARFWSFHFSRCQHRHRRIVGMQFGGSGNVFPDRVDQRTQQRAGANTGRCFAAWHTQADFYKRLVCTLQIFLAIADELDGRTVSLQTCPRQAAAEFHHPGNGRRRLGLFCPVAGTRHLPSYFVWTLNELAPISASSQQSKSCERR